MRANLLLVALCGLWGCATEVERPESAPAARGDAIVGGTVDLDDGGLYPASFYLRSDWNVGAPTACSSTLIAPRTLLTAAHCVDVRKMAGASSVNVFANDHSPHPASADPSWVQVSAITIHPNYNPSDFRDPYDLALVTLPQPSSVTPIPYNSRDVSTGYVGLPLTAVGWGLTGPSATDQGTRRFALLSFASVSATHILLGDNTSKGICNGDSGGPSLHTFPDGVTRVVGVHSYTEPAASCLSGGDVRADRFSSFISTYIMANGGSSCAEDGLCKAGCAPIDVDCACRADGQCNAACPNLLSDPDCPPDCVGNSVCATADCPVTDPDCVAELSACTQASQCQHRQCASDPQAGTRYCTTSCGTGGACPTGTACSAGVCLKTQRPEANPGDACTPGGTFCKSQTVCTGPRPGSTHCEKPCATVTDCGPNQKCLPGFDAVRFCQAQLMADAGEDCVPQVTMCQGGTICTGPVDGGTWCAVACANEAACGDTAHCVDGVLGNFCEAPERRLPVLGVSVAGAKAGCAAAPGLPGLMGVLLSSALRRRKRG